MMRKDRSLTCHHVCPRVRHTVLQPTNQDPMLLPGLQILQPPFSPQVPLHIWNLPKYLEIQKRSKIIITVNIMLNKSSDRHLNKEKNA